MLSVEGRAIEQLLRLLDEQLVDVYPYAVRWRLAECAIAHVDAKTVSRRVNRAVWWLRRTGHL